MAESKTTTKALSGSVALLIRQAITTPITAVGLIVLSRILSPTDFALQSIATMITSSSFLLIDGGLTQSLIQCKTLPTTSAIKQIRLYKYSISVLLLLILLCCTYFIRSFSDLNISTAPGFLGICVIAGLLQSERGHAAVDLQRLVNWKPLARIEIWEVVTQTSVAISVAAVMRNAWAFPIGMAARFLCGTMLLQKQPREAVEKSSTDNHPTTIPELLRFGIPTQVTSGLSLLQNAIIPIVVGSTAGLNESGLLVWSMSIASLPILPLQVFNSLLFSLGSDLRRKDNYDSSLLNRLTYLTLLSASIWGVLFALSLPFGINFVFGSKWMNALPLVSMLIVGNICVWFNAVLTSQIYAFGLSAERMKFAFAEFIMLWVLSGGGSLAAGASGYCIGFVTAQIVLMIWLAQVLGRAVNASLRPWRSVTVICACSVILLLLNLIRVSLFGLDACIAATVIMIIITASLLQQAITQMRAIPLINQSLPSLIRRD